MSTKCSVAYGPDFHLYREVFDEEHIYLQLEGVEYEASSQQVMVSIPMRIWEVIRRRGEADLSYAEKTDPEIQAEVEEWVDERLARYHEAQESGGVRGWRRPKGREPGVKTVLRKGRVCWIRP